MENTSVKNETNTANAGNTIGAIFFFASLIPYFILIYFGINGITFGMQVFARFYGIGGVIVGGIILLGTGVLPLSIVLQIILGRNVIAKNKKLSLITKIIYGFIVLMLILVTPISNALLKLKVEADPARITSYLEEKYGEEMASEVTIVFDRGEISDTNRYYKVYTPILKDGASFEVYYEAARGDYYTDDLIERFIEENNSYTNECEVYFQEKHGIPDNYVFESAYIEKIDFNDFHYGDDTSALLERTDYRIRDIQINISDSSDEALEENLHEFWNNEYLKYQAKENKYSMVINFSEDGASQARAYVHVRTNNKSTAEVYREGDLYVADIIVELD